MFESYWVLNRYVIREYLKVFFLSLSGLILIYIVVLFFQKVDLFIKHQAPFLLIFEYLLYKIPEVVFQWTLPYAVLLSPLLTLGTLSRHSEITAMKAGGVSLYRITIPLFMIALFISLFSFLGNEYLVPLTNQKTRYLLAVKVRKEQQTSFFKNYKLWYHSDRGIFNIQLLDAKEKILKGITLYQFDDQFRCTQRIDAREAKWDDGKWRFSQGAIREFGEGGSIRTVPFSTLEIALQEDWESFQRIERQGREMSYTELRNYIQRIQVSGYDSTRYLAELYSKLSYPFLNLIMVLIGIPFALKTGRSGGVALSVGISVMIGFAYGVTFYVFLSFGKSGVLPPFLAAWTPTVIFGLTGIFTLMSIRQ
ncbi:MAG: LPS export ABC transporter permease LptG [Deltaproteobacteria bacterium RBG_16_49_23]|nr:MAG: LPS export ABC transporter permease LptG [Deltaproteobacteria bacterium RBG_16_49_23]